MSWFRKPNVIDVKASHALICKGHTTPVRINLNGWGILKIKAVSQTDWPGINQVFSKGLHDKVFYMPMGSELKIHFINLFGFDNKQYFVPNASSQLQSIEAPDVSQIRLTEAKVYPNAIKSYVKNISANFTIQNFKTLIYGSFKTSNIKKSEFRFYIQRNYVSFKKYRHTSEK